jgi:hypothetical protein
MRIRRGPFALAIACVVLFVFGLTDTLVTQVRLHHAQVRLAETRDAVEQTSAQLAASQHELESTIATKNQDLATNTQLLDQLSAAEGRLSQAKQGLSSENFTLSNVDACIKGIEGAIGALQGGSRAATVSSLQGVAVPCETIEEDENPGGPVYPYDFPDPDVIEVGGTYYAYGTNTASGNVQIITSTDLAHWTLVGNALPQLASWATPGYTWAPSVIEDNGTFLLYYTVATPFTQCISVAAASQPQGPFNDVSSGPITCQPSQGGSIDPFPYTDRAGRLYLTWKTNGDGGRPATIWAQPLDPPGTAMASGSAPVSLLTPTQGWEGGVVEGPSIWDDQGTYFLFYSGNNWETASYAEGVAACSGPLGPCSKPFGGPILGSEADFSGPGGATVFTNAIGQPMIAFHGWLPNALGPPNPRLLFIRAIGTRDGLPFVGGT